MVCWHTNLTKEIFKDFNGKLQQYENKAAIYYGNAGGLKKNPLAIAKALDLAWKDGVKSQKLISCIERIITFIKK